MATFYPEQYWFLLCVTMVLHSHKMSENMLTSQYILYSTKRVLGTKYICWDDEFSFKTCW